MPKGHRFTSIGTAAVPGSSACDIVNRASARQIRRFAPDITFFDSDSSPMMKDMTELMTIISALVSLNHMIPIRYRADTAATSGRQAPETCTIPPSAKSSTPVTKLDASLARKTASLPISLGSATPTRFVIAGVGRRLEAAIERIVEAKVSALLKERLGALR